MSTTTQAARSRIAHGRQYTSDYIHRLASYVANTRTDVVDQYTPEEWIRLYDAYLASDWDFTVCQWAPWQREDAVKRGLAPAWDANEQPIESDVYLPGFDPK